MSVFLPFSLLLPDSRNKTPYHQLHIRFCPLLLLKIPHSWPIPFSQESSVFVLFSCSLASTFNLPITSSVPSFTPHPQNTICLSFSSLCTYCFSDSIVPRSDWTSDTGIGFTLRIQDFWDVTLYRLVNIYHSTRRNSTEVFSLQQHRYKKSKLGRFYIFIASVMEVLSLRIMLSVRKPAHPRLSWVQVKNM